MPKKKAAISPVMNKNDLKISFIFFSLTTFYILAEPPNKVNVASGQAREIDFFAPSDYIFL